MDLGLKDKVAVISGGSVGIGLAVTEGLAQEGVHVLAVRQQLRRLHLLRGRRLAECER